ncbi:MAG TPA: hypothetical protein PJ986_14750 [Gammaproteobacteria bacterium]|nr:hypothetical protein [Gammaproteobacteria bacterium]
MAEVVTQTQAPWINQQPFLTQVFTEGQRLYGLGGPQYYPTSTVAPFGQTTQNALGKIEGYGMNNPQLNQANQYFGNVIGGGFLNSNPYLDQMYGNAADAVTRQFNESVLPGVSAKFGMSGRSGSGLFQNAIGGAYDALGDTLSGLASNMYGQNYAAERQMQQQAAQFAPNLAQANFGAMKNVLDAGQIRDQQAQMQLNDQVKRYQFNQMRPYDNLSRYAGYVGGSGYGASRTTTSPTESTPWYAYALGGLQVAPELVGGLRAIGSLLF